MEKLEIRPLIFEQTEIVRAGAFVTLDRYDELAVYRGYVRPEDERRDESTAQDGVDPALAGQGDDLATSDGDGSDARANVTTVITSGGQPFGVGPAEDEHDGTLKPLPERLVTELTAHRTLALREAVGRSPDVALTLLLSKLVTDTFQSTGSSGGCLEASVRQIYMSAQAADLKDSPVDTYLNRVPKARIIEAVREDKGEGTAQLLDHLKKGEMATEAERLLKGSGWLPEVLRRNDLVVLDGEGSVEGQGVDAEAAESVSDSDLPTFPTDDLPGGSASMLAAERDQPAGSGNIRLQSS